LLAIGAFPASKEVENEDDDEDDWGSTLYRPKHILGVSVALMGLLTSVQSAVSWDLLCCSPLIGLRS
jgi:hypothetical protein